MTLANIFGRHSDSRLIEALASQPQKEFAFDADLKTGEFWLDYVSDIADGWNPTYAIANAGRRIVVRRRRRMARRSPVAATCWSSGATRSIPIRRRKRTRPAARPLTARPSSARDRRPHLFAVVPGNHDWYDSLVAFSRTFCRPERGFAGLPDAPDTQPFRAEAAARLVAAGDRPAAGRGSRRAAGALFPGCDLADAAARARDPVRAGSAVDLRGGLSEHASYSDGALRYFEEHLLRRKVAVFSQRIRTSTRPNARTACRRSFPAAAVAFLHPTHAPATDHLRGGFRERAQVSRRPDPAATDVVNRCSRS